MKTSLTLTPLISISAALGTCLAVALPTSAVAVPVTYNYVGNAFTRVDSPPLGNHVTANVTFASEFSAPGEVKDASSILS